MNEYSIPQESPEVVPPLSESMVPPEVSRSAAKELQGISDAEVRALTTTATPSATVPDRGTELRGRVVGTGGDGVFVDVGLRSQALVPKAQFGDGFVPETGQEIDLVVVRLDPTTDLLRANLKGAVVRADADSLMPGVMVECKITGMIKGGLEVQLGSTRAFMPASHVDTAHVKDISIFLGQTVLCEVLEMGKRGKSIIVSRRKAIEKEQIKARQQLLAELEVGQTRSGVVRNLTDYGAFVDLGGLHGLLHVSDMRWTPVDKPSDVVKEGDEITVKILKINMQRNRVSLGLKQVTPDPWTDVEERYPAGTHLNVRIVKLAEFGAFAEVCEGVNGLIPLTEISWGHRPSGPQQLLEVGQTVEVVVLNADAKRRRIGLSIKQVTGDPWRGVADDFKPNSVVSGKVSTLLDFGVLVELRSGVEGMVHISELSDKRVKTPAEVVSIGDEIQVKVLSVDTRKRRIALSLKSASEKTQAPKPDEPTPAPLKPRRKKPLRGGLASHFEW